MGERVAKLTKITLWMGMIFLIIRCLLSWESFTNNFSVYAMLSYIGEAVGMAVFMATIYERFLWRFNPLEDAPKLNKRYQGTLKSTHDGIEREVSLEIKQTLLTISVVLISDESRSRSITASIENILGEKQLTYCYLNTPKASVRDKSGMHYGTAMLCVDDVNRLTGHYFSDRKTTGDIVFTTNIGSQE